MRHLYLIRHASPLVQPDVPAREWTLSPRGVEEASRLVETARAWGLAAIYASPEPKARATALILGDALALTPHVVDGLEELRFDEWISNADDFARAVREILEQPHDWHRGAERAADAAARFAAALRLVAQGAFPAAVISHGRVISAYLSDLLRPEDPVELWRSIPMPGWTHFDLDAPALEPFRS